MSASLGKRTISAPQNYLNDLVDDVSIFCKQQDHSKPAFSFLKDYDPLADRRRPTIGDKLAKDDYRARQLNRRLSPERVDPFAEGSGSSKL